MKKVRRYLVIKRLSGENSAHLIAESISKVFGIYGLSMTRPVLVYSKGSYDVVSVLREGVPLVRAALALYNYDKILIAKITGTSRKAKRIVESIPSQEP